MSRLPIGHKKIRAKGTGGAAAAPPPDPNAPNFLGAGDAGVGIEQTLLESPDTARQEAGVLLEEAPYTAVVDESTGLALSHLNSGEAAHPDADAGLLLSQQYSGPSPVPGRGAAKIVRVKYDVTHLSGATLATNVGTDPWTNVANAQGRPDGVLATRAGALMERTARMQLDYADLSNKSAMSIVSVKLKFYFNITGDLTNQVTASAQWMWDGAVEHSIGSWNTNVDHLTTPHVVDITAGSPADQFINGSWSRLDSLQAFMFVNITEAQVAVTMRVDAVELEVVAALTQTV